MRLEYYFTSIAHLSDKELEFYGWYLVDENDKFKIYSRPYGEDKQIVEIDDPFLRLDDLNDANFMQSTLNVRFAVPGANS